MIKSKKILIVVCGNLAFATAPLISLVSCSKTPFSQVTLTITTDEHGSVSPNTLSVNKGSTFGEIKSQISYSPDAGYEFDKWVDDNGNEINDSFMLNSDTTIKALFIESTSMLDFDWSYDHDAGTATVTEYTGQGGVVVIPSTVKHDGKTFTVIKIDAKAFFRSETIERIVLPDSITRIGDKAFSGCSKLNQDELVFSDNIKSIGNEAFRSTPIKSFYISASVETIGISAFGDCNSAGKIVVDKNNVVFTSRDENGKEGNFIVNKNTKTLICGIRTTTKIPFNITTIGESAFDNLSDIKFETIPNNITILEKEAFISTRMSTIEIPSSVTSIGEYAFAFTNLTTIKFYSDFEDWPENFNTTMFNYIPTAGTFYCKTNKIIELVKQKISAVKNWNFSILSD